MNAVLHIYIATCDFKYISFRFTWFHLKVEFAGTRTVKVAHFIVVKKSFKKIYSVQKKTSVVLKEIIYGLDSVGISYKDGQNSDFHV